MDSKPDALPALNLARVSSGVPGLDTVLGGGFVRGHSYLLVGGAGTGKTLLSLQWLRHGAACGERVLYLTLAEPASELRANAGALGWSLDGVEIGDLSPTGAELAQDLGDYSVFSPAEVEEMPLWRSIRDRVVASGAQRVVVDSLTQLRYLSADTHQFRKHVLLLVNFLNSSGCTSFLLFEPDELVRETCAALASNGVIRLTSGISPSVAIGLRSIQVEKMRGSDFLAGRHPLRIGREGHVVFPHVVERVGNAGPGGERLATGIAELDELLGGGFESGTTTLLSGPAGTGKSTLGSHFLACQAPGVRSVLFTSEESTAMLVGRARATGAPIDAAIASGAMRVERINALERYPDEFLAQVRHAVEVEGRTLVMIDSLRGYTLAMEEFGSPQAHVHNLIAYLTGRGATTLLVSEVENVTSPNVVATDMGVSHLADNIILMRYAEDAGRVIKVLSCLKKRAGDFQPELRELQITGQGLRVGGKLHHLRGVLTGAPKGAAAA